MVLTEREVQILDEIERWEQKLMTREPNDLQQTFDRFIDHMISYLPEEIQNDLFTYLDTSLFHLHSFLQSMELQQGAIDKIVGTGRIFDPNIESVEDLKRLPIDQLIYIANQQVVRHRAYSFAQGFATGTGEALLLGIDFPTLLVINMRMVQLIGTSYGYAVNTPFEMMTSLKVVHAATLPKRIQKYSWNELITEVNRKETDYFYNGKEQIIDPLWLENVLIQLAKSIVILFWRKKKFQNLPIVSVAIGAGMNHSLTKNVGEFAQKFYQKRLLLEKERKNGFT